jgi:tetratricopeptide (TPR) repeat protein
MGDFQPEDALEAFGIQALLMKSEGSGESAWDSYTEALTAFQSRSWQDAIQLLKQAISVQPVPRSSPRYTPYFYLGRAYDWTENWDEALRAFELSVSYGTIASFPEDQVRMQQWELRIKMDRPFEIIEVKREDQTSGKAAAVTRQEKQDSAEPEPQREAANSSQTSEESSSDLDQAILQFFRGEYWEAATAAEACLENKTTERQTAHFLAGASLYAQYLLFGANDTELRGRALEHFGEVQTFAPPERYISPALMKTFLEAQP